jgi:hypothetical protein
MSTLVTFSATASITSSVALFYLQGNQNFAALPPFP